MAASGSATTPPSPRPWWLRLIFLFLEYLSDILTASSAALLAFAGVAASWSWKHRTVESLWWAGVILAVASIVYSRAWHRPTLNRLNKDNEELSEQVKHLTARVTDHTVSLIDVVNILLRELAMSVDIYKRDTRLSVYRHKDDSFYLVGRVSPNREYGNVGRVSYPDTQGFIGKLWRGEDVPPTLRFPDAREDWIATLVEGYGFTEEEASALRMKTLAMTGVKLQQDDHGPAFGVLCIECDRKRTTVTGGTIGSVTQAPEFKTLTAVLHFAVIGMTDTEARRGLTQGRQQ